MPQTSKIIYVFLMCSFDFWMFGYNTPDSIGSFRGTCNRHAYLDCAKWFAQLTSRQQSNWPINGQIFVSVACIHWSCSDRLIARIYKHNISASYCCNTLWVDVMKNSSTIYNTVAKNEGCDTLPQFTANDLFVKLSEYIERCIHKQDQNDLLRTLLNETDEIQTQNQLRKNELVIVIAVFATLITFGACGSMVVMYAAVRRPQMRTPHNLFILNLAVSDFVLCVFTQPFNLLRVLNSHYDWRLGQAMCKIVSMGQATSIFVSTFSIIAIALDRLQVRWTDNLWTRKSQFSDDILTKVLSADSFIE